MLSTDSELWQRLTAYRGNNVKFKLDPNDNDGLEKRCCLCQCELLQIL